MILHDCNPLSPFHEREDYRSKVQLERPGAYPLLRVRHFESNRQEILNLIDFETLKPLAQSKLTKRGPTLKYVAIQLRNRSDTCQQ